MTVEPWLERLREMAEHVPSGDIERHKLVQAVGIKLNEHFSQPRVEADLQDFLYVIRSVSARTDGLTTLFCLHAALESAKMSCAGVTQFPVINEAVQQLGQDFAAQYKRAMDLLAQATNRPPGSPPGDE